MGDILGTKVVKPKTKNILILEYKWNSRKKIKIQYKYREGTGIGQFQAFQKKAN